MQKKIILLVILLYLIVLFREYYIESKTNIFYKVLKTEKGSKGGIITYDGSVAVRFTNFDFYKVNIAVNDFVSKQKCSNTLYILRETDTSSNKLIVIDSIVGNEFFSKLGCAF